MSLRIHIEQISLDGFSLSDSQQAILRRALAQELRTLLAKQPVEQWRQDWQQTFDQPLSMDTSGNDPGQLGQRLAQTIHAGLRQ